MKISRQEIQEKFNTIDLLICSSGFEDRSTSLPLSLDKSKIKEAVLFHIDENYIKSYENYLKVQEHLDFIRKIEYPKNNPLETYDIFCSEIKSFLKSSYVGNKLNVLVDVTTFTREVLLILIKVLSLSEISKNIYVNLVYTPAESYPCEWLTKGVRQIRSIFGYSGMNYPSKKHLLVILNGFETERTEEVINSFEANKILLGKPSKPHSINDKLNEISEEKFQYIKQKYYSSLINEFEFSCLEINETVEKIEDIIDQYSSEYNIVIAPLNNKVSTIGCAIVAIKNEDVQICYASANQYNINAYSKGSEYFLIYTLSDYI
jgi:hypothetical protein